MMKNLSILSFPKSLQASLWMDEVQAYVSCIKWSWGDP